MHQVDDPVAKVHDRLDFFEASPPEYEFKIWPGEAKISRSPNEFYLACDHSSSFVVLGLCLPLDLQLWLVSLGLPLWEFVSLGFLFAPVGDDTLFGLEPFCVFRSFTLLGSGLSVISQHFQRRIGWRYSFCQKPTLFRFCSRQREPLFALIWGAETHCRPLPPHRR